jgi:hypothetical protein
MLTRVRLIGRDNGHALLEELVRLGFARVVALTPQELVWGKRGDEALE